MRISDIKVFIPQVGLRPQCLVKVETDSGIFGWGESGLTAREEAVASAIGHFRSLLVGEDPMQRGKLWQRLYRSQYFEGGRVLLAAQSAIDIALHDIIGKAWGVPCTSCWGAGSVTSYRCSRRPAHHLSGTSWLTRCRTSGGGATACLAVVTSTGGRSWIPCRRVASMERSPSSTKTPSGAVRLSASNVAWRSLAGRCGR